MDPDWIARRVLLGFALAVIAVAALVLLALQGGRL